MKIIFHNVNVILPDGVIFASGDKSRIGTIHEAGRQAALERKRVNIYPDGANLFKGVAPGINQPIIIDGQVQMVLGVTGNPNEISRYAELAFLTAELLINQALANENQTCKSVIRDIEFSYLLTKSDRTDNSAAGNYENDLSAYVSLPAFLYLVQATGKGQLSSIVFDLIQSIKKLSDKSEIIVVKPNLFIILNDLVSSFEKQLDVIKNAVSGKDVLINIGCFDGLGNNISSVKLLLTYVNYGIEELNSVISSDSAPPGTTGHENVVIKDLYSSEHLSSFLLRTFPKSKLYNSIKALFDVSLQGAKLIETIMVFVAENQEVSRTAERLGVHRNTIQKRFEMIKQLTCLDPARFKDLMILYVALTRTGMSDKEL